MKLKYQMSKGRRIKRRGFLGVTVARGDSLLWWSYDLGRWVPGDELPHPIVKGYSNHAPCRSVRAFRKMIKANPHIRGRALLVSCWVGYHVRG